MAMIGDMSGASSREVTRATSVVPMKVVPSPVMSAMRTLLLTINGVTMMSAAAASPKPISALRRLGMPSGRSASAAAEPAPPPAFCCNRRMAMTYTAISTRLSAPIQPI